VAAACLLATLGGVAHAGGFSRGSADTDILFEDGNFNMRAGVTYVSPTRKFSSGLPGAEGLVGTSYTDDYAIPSMAIKLNVSDNFRCAGTMVDNNGGSATYAVPKPSGKLEEDFTTNEKALTCGVKFQAGRGNFWIIGGGFVENFDYNRLNATGVLPLSMIGGTDVVMPNANLRLSGEDVGYRLGVAYEIPEIALRAQLMYRSGTSYGADGSLTVPTAALLGAQAQALAATDPVAAGQLLAQAGQALAAGSQTMVDATGTGNLPQSVELKLQSGIAPGWLAFGSVKWMDWSVQKNLLVESSIKDSDDVYNWKDGWTVTGGVGHAFTDRISGLVSLTWDSGVNTGYDLSSDTYTLVVGASLKDNLGGELRAAIGYSYLTSAKVTKGDDAGLAVKAGDAVAFNVGYNIKW
jgi:long-chain fatty acid transport protein